MPPVVRRAGALALRVVTVVLALLSSVLWGGADFLGGTLTRSRSAHVVVGASQAAGLVTVLLIAAASGAWHAPRGYLVPALAAGLSGMVALLAYYTALAIGTMGVVSPIAATGVVVPVLVSLARGERPSPTALAGIAVAVLGVVLASGPELSGRAGARSLLLALVAAAGFGLALLFIAEGARSSTVMTLVTMRVASVGLLAGAGLARLLAGRRAGDVAGPPDPGAPVPPGLWQLRFGGLLVLTGVADVMANLTFGQASRTGLVSVVAVLGSLYPVVTVLLAAGVHGERLARVQQVGVIAAMCGVGLIVG